MTDYDKLHADVVEEFPEGLWIPEEEESW